MRSFTIAKDATMYGMKIPSTVLIGAIRYKVRVIPEWLGSEGADGECHYSSEVGNVIYIRSTLSREAREVTFLHECLHAMNSTMDHEFLDSFSEQIYAFLSLNNLLA